MRFSVAFAVLAGMAAAGAAAAWAQAPKTSWDGVYSEEQSKRGAALYSEHCAGCHGDDLAGTGSEAPALTGRKLLAKWDDVTIGAILDQMVMTMPQDAQGSLTRVQHTDIMAFLLAKNGFPAGPTELASQPEVLSIIKIVAKKP